MAKKRKTIYYEFWKLQGSGETLVSTGTRILGTNTITTGVDTIPTATLTVPLEDLPAEEIKDGKEPNMALYIVKIFYQVDDIVKYTFIGTVDTLEVDYAAYTASMNLSHRVARMREWVMPVGYTVKQGTISYIIGKDGADLGYSSTMGPSTQVYESSVEFELRDGVGDIKMDISFSSSNKLEALQEVLDNTEDVHFVVDLADPQGDKIILGKFGDNTGVLISPTAFYEDDCTERDMSKVVTMLTEPVYNSDYTEHFNRAVVFCGDVAEGVMHMTLKEIYENKDTLENPLFPVDKYDKAIEIQPETEWEQGKKANDRVYNTSKINNEKVYNNLEVVAYANNDNREYYVTDLEQFREDGIVKHTTYDFNDLYPIPDLEKEEDKGDGSGEKETVEYAITDDDRREIVKRAYARAIRRLKEQRPEHVWQFNCTPLPYNFQDGQKVNFFFTKRVIKQDDDCDDNGREQVIALVQRELYMTKRTITFDSDLNEINTVTLDRELRFRDITDPEYELTVRASKPSESSGGDGSGGVADYPDLPDDISGHTNAQIDYIL